MAVSCQNTDGAEYHHKHPYTNANERKMCVYRTYACANICSNSGGSRQNRHPLSRRRFVREPAQKKPGRAHTHPTGPDHTTDRTPSTGRAVTNTTLVGLRRSRARRRRPASARGAVGCFHLILTLSAGTAALDNLRGVVDTLGGLADCVRFTPRNRRSRRSCQRSAGDPEQTLTLP